MPCKKTENDPTLVHRGRLPNSVSRTESAKIIESPGPHSEISSLLHSPGFSAGSVLPGQGVTSAWAQQAPGDCGTPPSLLSKNERSCCFLVDVLNHSEKMPLPNNLECSTTDFPTRSTQI